MLERYTNYVRIEMPTLKYLKDVYIKKKKMKKNNKGNKYNIIVLPTFQEK